MRIGSSSAAVTGYDFPQPIAVQAAVKAGRRCAWSLDRAVSQEPEYSSGSPHSCPCVCRRRDKTSSQKRRMRARPLSSRQVSSASQLTEEIICRIFRSWWQLAFWGAHACSVLVAAFCGDELSERANGLRASFVWAASKSSVECRTSTLQRALRIGSRSLDVRGRNLRGAGCRTQARRSLSARRVCRRRKKKRRPR